MLEWIPYPSIQSEDEGAYADKVIAIEPLMAGCSIHPSLFCLMENEYLGGQFFCIFRCHNLTSRNQMTVKNPDTN